jgi:DNA-binding SARP family transcriptional activator
VTINGQPIHLGPKLRRLLAVLLLESGRIVPKSRLIELLWGQEASSRAADTLRSHVARLRKTLGLDPSAAGGGTALRTEQAGYRLQLESRDQIDAFQFKRDYTQGRQALEAGDFERAARHLHAALRWWRGEVLSNVVSEMDVPFPVAEVERLTNLRDEAQHARIDADLALGRHTEVIGAARQLLSLRPDSEDLRQTLALALYRSGRIKEATTVCAEGIRQFHDQGMEAPSLQKLQRAILQRDPQLAWTSLPRAPRGPSTGQGIKVFDPTVPHHNPNFMGRTQLLDRLRAVLTSSSEGIQAVALHGLGGVGEVAPGSVGFEVGSSPARLT